ncbi:hypothetical protein SEA_CAMERICO_2 [Gordonia phage Camerico]|nr:hypothetical protein SEA_CAMERICO_2 [Gordonia phage Camerico]
MEIRVLCTRSSAIIATIAPIQARKNRPEHTNNGNINRGNGELTMNNPVITSKNCTKCGENLPIEYFYPDHTRSDGYKNICKDCNSTYPLQRPGYIERGHVPANEMTGKTKMCPSCMEVKDLALFSRDKGKPDGRRSNCKKCRAGTWKRYSDKKRTDNTGSDHAGAGAA